MSINLVALTVRLFNEIVKNIQPDSVPLLKKSLQTIIEMIQVSQIYFISI